MWGGIEIIGIELDGKTAAGCGIDRLIPTTANTKILTLGNDDHQSVPIFLFQRGQHVGSAIGTVVINDNHIIVERRLLFTGTLHGITNGLDTIVYGNHHTGLTVEGLLM